MIVYERLDDDSGRLGGERYLNISVAVGVPVSMGNLRRTTVGSPPFAALELAVMNVAMGGKAPRQ